MPSSDSQTQPSHSPKRWAEGKPEEFMPVELKGTDRRKRHPSRKAFQKAIDSATAELTKQARALRKATDNVYKGLHKKSTVERNALQEPAQTTKKPLANWKVSTLKTSGEIISKTRKEFDNLAGLTWNTHTLQWRRRRPHQRRQTTTVSQECPKNHRHIHLQARWGQKQ